MSVGFQAFARENELLGAALSDALAKVMVEGRYIMGPSVVAFEEAFAHSCGAKHALAVASGTDAIVMALMAAGVQPGSEVITTAFSFVATAAAICRVGAVPVFVDVAADTANICPAGVAKAANGRTGAILPVHLFGRPADMQAINATAKRWGVPVIEDACQAFGAKVGNVSVGNLGNLGCFSFFPTKNLGGYGDGGALVTDDDAIAEKVDVLRRQGCAERHVATVVGLNSRLDTLQAAILLQKLPFVERWVTRRNEIAARYRALLSGVRMLTHDPGHSYNQFVVLVQDRDGVRARMAGKGVATAVYYPLPLPLHPAFAAFSSGDYSVSGRLSGEVLCLPIHPFLRDEEVEYVATTLREALH